ncbi:MAG: hypothetical protein KJ000_08050 [Pirellulaceae bacterium]|nr:hypothetical protein [Pirellulaceae bacterium]
MSDESVTSLIPTQFYYQLGRLVSDIEKKRKDTPKAYVQGVQDFILAVRNALNLDDGFLNHDFENVETALKKVLEYCDGDSVGDREALVFADYVEIKLKNVIATYDCFKDPAE